MAEVQRSGDKRDSLRHFLLTLPHPSTSSSQQLGVRPWPPAILCPLFLCHPAHQCHPLQSWFCSCESPRQPSTVDPNVALCPAPRGVARLQGSVSTSVATFRRRGPEGDASPTASSGGSAPALQTWQHALGPPGWRVGVTVWEPGVSRPSSPGLLSERPQGRATRRQVFLGNVCAWALGYC